MVFCGISDAISQSHLRALLTHSYSCVHVCLTRSVMSVNPITHSHTRQRKELRLVGCDRSDFCSTAAKVIVSTDPHVCWAWGGCVFFQPRYEIATLAALEWFGNEREAPQIGIGEEMMSLTF